MQSKKWKYPSIGFLIMGIKKLSNIVNIYYLMMIKNFRVGIRHSQLGIINLCTNRKWWQQNTFHQTQIVSLSQQLRKRKTKSQSPTLQWSSMLSGLTFRHQITAGYKHN